MKYLIKINKKLNFLFRRQKDQDYVIGRFKIKLPSNHMLPTYQAKYKMYDKNIYVIVKNAIKLNKINIILDIGANIGDSAAVFRSCCNAKIISIEGDENFAKYLKKNAELFDNINIIDSYVGNESILNSSYYIERNASTSSLVKSNKNNNVDLINFITINDILSKLNIKNNEIDFIKIDTDGFDFDILLDNKSLIECALPILYFDYDINIKPELIDKSIDLITFLSSLNYKFAIYDNYGNLLNYFSNNILIEFKKLNLYLSSSKLYGGGIYYFDVLATTDYKLIENIVNEINIVNENFI